VDAAQRQVRTMIPERNPDCPACGQGQVQVLSEEVCATNG
jgi:hypothetical protein